MYSKEFCRTIANGRTRTDPEAARVIHWLLDALDETEVAALDLKTQLNRQPGVVGEFVPHSDQLCKGPNCNAVRGGVHSPECVESNNPTKQ